MTEYTSSPAAIKELMTSKERTEWWIRHHPQAGLMSPSAPPSEMAELEWDTQSYTPYDSDAESTHSIPPKMLLKFGDGRPDVSISHWHYGSGIEPLARSGSKRERTMSEVTAPTHRRSRSKQPSRKIQSRQIDDSNNRGPEEIRVLPSVTATAAPSQSPHRSKSQPRYGNTNSEDPPLPVPPPTRHISAPKPRNAQPPSAPKVAYSQSHPMYHAPAAYPSRYAEHLPPHHQAPYPVRGSVPLSTHPQPILVQPPRGAPRVAFNQMAPKSRYPQHTTPFPAMNGGLAAVGEERMSSRDRMGSLKVGGPQRPLTGHEYARPSSRLSEESGSTYFMVPTPGQKVQIVVPDKSLYTATSTTQSPSPPQSGTSKKPFFSRFFHLAEKLASNDSKSSSGGSRRLQRRHSTGARGRPPLPIPARS